MSNIIVVALIIAIILALAGGGLFAYYGKRRNNPEFDDLRDLEEIKSGYKYFIRKFENSPHSSLEFRGVAGFKARAKDIDANLKAKTIDHKRATSLYKGITEEMKRLKNGTSQQAA